MTQLGSKFWFRQAVEAAWYGQITRPSASARATPAAISGKMQLPYQPVA
jgi:hypothetical protein